MPRSQMLTTAIAAISIFCCSAAIADETTAAKAAPAIKFTAEFQEKLKALSPEKLKMFGKIDHKHKRKSNTASLRQVMYEVGLDMQCMVSGLFIENMEMVAECADRISHHRWPKGGIFAYAPLDLINDGTLDWLPTVNKQVEGGADKVAAAARAGDVFKAAEEVGKVITGCIGCHQVMFKNKGESPYIVE